MPFCEEMCNLTNEQFTFVATEPVPQERLSMGYHDMNKSYPFVLTTYDSKEAEHKAIRLADECDAVITGSAPEYFTQNRIRKNRITFRYSERLYKQGYIYLFAPKRIKNMWENHMRYRNKPLYMLCASAFTAGDYALNGAYWNKTFQWGYFPEVKTYDLDELFAKKRQNSPASILWVGRLIGWKHPEVPILIGEKLKKDGIPFQLNIIGNGEMEGKLRKMILERQIDDNIHMLGAMSPERVREYMEKADIFLFTSDFHEGWGAVLNESMNSGCAVVASSAIGSTQFLIQDGWNGLIYKNSDISDLYGKVTYLLGHKDKRVDMGHNAYQTMLIQWNANIAAKRFLRLCEAIENGEKTPYEKGPCSVAKRIYQGKFM